MRSNMFQALLHLLKIKPVKPPAPVKQEQCPYKVEAPVQSAPVQKQQKEAPVAKTAATKATKKAAPTKSKNKPKPAAKNTTTESARKK